MVITIMGMSPDDMANRVVNSRMMWDWEEEREIEDLFPVPKRIERFTLLSRYDLENGSETISVCVRGRKVKADHFLVFDMQEKNLCFRSDGRWPKDVMSCILMAKKRVMVKADNNPDLYQALEHGGFYSDHAFCTRRLDLVEMRDPAEWFRSTFQDAVTFAAQMQKLQQRFLSSEPTNVLEQTWCETQLGRYLSFRGIS